MNFWQKLHRWLRGQCTKHTTEELLIGYDHGSDSMWDPCYCGPIIGCPDCYPEEAIAQRGWNSVNDEKLDAWLASRETAEANA